MIPGTEVQNSKHKMLNQKKIVQRYKQKIDLQVTVHHTVILASTFGILWGFAGFMESSFFPLYYSGISSQKAFLFQRGSMVLAHLQQCTSNAECYCLSLTREAATMSFHKNIIASFITQSYQRDFYIL